MTVQQREQLILQKLAEAREAQTSAMTRFIQARARVMQVEARLRAAQADLSHQEETPAPAPQPAEHTPAHDSGAERVITPALSLPGKPIPETPAPVLDPAGLALALDLSALIDESGLNALAHVLADEPVPIQDVPTTFLASPAPPVPLPPAPAFEPAVQDAPTVFLAQPQQSTDDEETKKRPTVPLPTLPARQEESEEEETLLVSMSALLEAREAREAAAREQADRQTAEATSAGDTSATDITTKIPVIRQERGKPQEPA